MRLFHVSEEEDILVFNPRIPTRCDLDQSVGLVWAINECCLPNFLTPRDCPRVTYYSGDCATKEDKLKYFSSSTTSHTIVIESKWFELMSKTTLYVYEFNSLDFELQDEVAGYYVAKQSQIPKAKYKLDHLFQELFSRQIEVRIVDNLWDICDEIKHSSLNWSMCRMGNAQPRE
ncbi:MAG: DUF6886 family protein [Turicibacter sp.]